MGLDNHLDDSASPGGHLFEQAAGGRVVGPCSIATGKDLRSAELLAEEDMIVAGTESFFGKIEALAQSDSAEEVTEGRRHLWAGESSLLCCGHACIQAARPCRINSASPQVPLAAHAPLIAVRRRSS